MPTYPITLTVNRVPYPLDVDPHASLLHTVREDVGLTGSKEGCDDSECGACMMLIDGRPVNSCSYLAVQADGAQVTTVEGLADQGGAGDLSDLQAAFLRRGAVQCGFCTPGMLISATSLLEREKQPSEAEIRTAISGNLCRCTGYDGIVQAIAEVAAQRSATGDG
jgi:carbon-monoxide dehydrogenase small subunit